MNSLLIMPTKYVLALASISLRPTRSLSQHHSLIWNLDYTVSHHFPDPDMASSSPPVLSPTFTDENPFPSLPPIHNNDLRTKVFTHRSFYARPNHVFEDHPDDPSPDNEKWVPLAQISRVSLTATQMRALGRLRPGDHCHRPPPRHVPQPPCRSFHGSPFPNTVSFTFLIHPLPYRKFVLLSLAIPHSRLFLADMSYRLSSGCIPLKPSP